MESDLKAALELVNSQLTKLLNTGITAVTSENLAQVGGSTVDKNTGTVGNGTQRVTLATDISLPPLPASELHLGAIGGNSTKIAITPTTSATAYAINDNIGGILTLANALRVSGGTAIIEDIVLWALANQKPNLYIDFWDASPSGTYTNDAAQIIAGDQAKHLGFVEIAAADWRDTGVISRVHSKAIGLLLKGNASTNVYMTIQDKTGVTLGSVAGLFGKIGILQD